MLLHTGCSLPKSSTHTGCSLPRSSLNCVTEGESWSAPTTSKQGRTPEKVWAGGVSPVAPGLGIQMQCQESSRARGVPALDRLPHKASNVRRLEAAHRSPGCHTVLSSVPHSATLSSQPRHLQGLVCNHTSQGQQG